jgi:hypothetical protein
MSIPPTGLTIEDARLGDTVCIAALPYIIIDIVEDGEQYVCSKLHSKDKSIYYFYKDQYLDYISIELSKAK